MSTFVWILVCLFAGWLTSRVLRDRGWGVRFGSMIGIAGAVLGGVLAAYLLNIAKAVSGINLTSILVAFIGAVLTIIILRSVAPRFRFVS